MSSLSEVTKAWVEHVIDGKFPLRQWLGGSAHSAVFLTERSAPESQKAAIKLIPADRLPAGTEGAQLLHWENAAKLAHPHVMRVFEYGRCQVDNIQYLYVVQEYAEENLAQIIPERALAAEEVAQMLPPVVEALAFLHQSGFVHSRIQPSNVMAVHDQLKITADGLCIVGEPGQRRGSAYDAPEVATVVTPAADVWSLGVLLVTVLSQHEPDVNHRNGGQVGVPDAVPQPFHEIAQQCLRADPRRRITISQILGKLKGEAAVSTAASSNSSTLAAAVPVAPAVAARTAATEARITPPAKISAAAA